MRGAAAAASTVSAKEPAEVYLESRLLQRGRDIGGRPGTLPSAPPSAATDQPSGSTRREPAAVVRMITVATESTNKNDIDSVNKAVPLARRTVLAVIFRYETVDQGKQPDR